MKQKITLNQAFATLLTCLCVLLADKSHAQRISISALSSGRAIPGNTITISGANFNSTLTRNFIFFGAVRAAIVSGSTTSLTVTVPSGATIAPVTVTDSATRLTAIAGQNSGSFMMPFAPAYDTTGFLTDSINIRSQAQYTVTTGSGKPIGAAIGDINGDGRPDLISCNADSTSLSILINNGTTGLFSASSFTLSSRLALGGRPNNVKLADLNGDGWLDIVVTLTNNNGINIFRNTSTSASSLTFAARQSVSVGGLSTVAACADFNADGKMDIAVTLVSGYVGILKNTSSSAVTTFAPVSLVATGSTPIGLNVADFDGDGLVDIAAANSGFTGTAYTGNTVSLIRNTTSGGAISFSSASSITTGSGPIDIASADLDADGLPDLLITNLNDATFSVLRNSSSGVGVVSFETKVDIATGYGPTGINVADFNGDGKMDVVVSNAFSSSLSFYKNTTSGSFINFAARQDKNAGSFPATITVGDLDGDKFPDVVVGNQTSNNISVFKNYPLPRIGSFGSVATVCPGTTATLTNSISGGFWTIASSSIATISPTGTVTGVAAGTTVATYSVVVQGDTNFGTTPVVVIPTANAGSIIGPSSVCPGGQCH